MTETVKPRISGATNRIDEIKGHSGITDNIGMSGTNISENTERACKISDDISNPAMKISDIQGNGNKVNYRPSAWQHVVRIP